MATSALHRELGVPVRVPVSFDLLSKLVEKGVREQADLDFKQTLYHPKNDKDKRELVKDVCAMANTGGGWIICGIAEKDNVAVKVVGLDLGITSETDVHQMLENRIDPPLTVSIRVYQSENQEKNLVAISVPDSSDRPHLIRTGESKDTKAFQVPARKGASTVWLDERALRDMYRVSFNMRDQTEDNRTQRLDELSTKAGEEYPGIALVLVLSPHERLTGKLDKREVQSLLKQADLGRFAFDQGYSPLERVSGSLSVGDRRYIGRQTTLRLHAFIEIDFDGTIAIAIQLSIDDPRLTHKGSHLYTGQVDETTQKEVEYALIEAFNCASQLSYELNPASDSELQVSLVPHEDDPIIIRKNEGAWSGSLLRAREESIPIKRFRTTTRTLQASPSPEEEHEILTDLVFEVLNQGGIETTRVLQPIKQSDETSLQ